jgi:hypothetical protein
MAAGHMKPAAVACVVDVVIGRVFTLDNKSTNASAGRQSYSTMIRIGSRVDLRRANLKQIHSIKTLPIQISSRVTSLF